VPLAACSRTLCLTRRLPRHAPFGWTGFPGSHHHRQRAFSGRDLRSRQRWPGGSYDPINSKLAWVAVAAMDISPVRLRSGRGLSNWAGDKQSVRWSITCWTEAAVPFSLRTPQRYRNELGETTVNKTSGSDHAGHCRCGAGCSLFLKDEHPKTEGGAGNPRSTV
jgi:hypothetical protein